jgi:hypothetical protein
MRRLLVVFLVVAALVGAGTRDLGASRPSAVANTLAHLGQLAAPIEAPTTVVALHYSSFVRPPGFKPAKYGSWLQKIDFKPPTTLDTFATDVRREHPATGNDLIDDVAIKRATCQSLKKAIKAGKWTVTIQALEKSLDSHVRQLTADPSPGNYYATARSLKEKVKEQTQPWKTAAAIHFLWCELGR